MEVRDYYAAEPAIVERLKTDSTEPNGWALPPTWKVVTADDLADPKGPKAPPVPSVQVEFHGENIRSSGNGRIIDIEQMWLIIFVLRRQGRDTRAAREKFARLILPAFHHLAGWQPAPWMSALEPEQSPYKITRSSDGKIYFPFAFSTSFRSQTQLKRS